MTENWLFENNWQAKDDIKVSVIIAKKYEVKAKNFIISTSFYGN